MKNYLIILTLVIGLFGLNQKANALLEIRGNYTLNTAKNDVSEDATIPDAKTLGGIGADVIVKPPVFPIGLGVRYENLGVEASLNDIKAKAAFTRMALLVNYRFIDTLAFVGVIGSYSLSQKYTFDITYLGTDYAKVESTAGSTYSVGIEGGAKLMGFLIGGELGILNGEVGKGKESINNVETDAFTVDGTYAKIHIGFAF